MSNDWEKKKHREVRMKPNGISRSMLDRIPSYLAYLQDISKAGIKNISSTKLAQDLGYGEVLVRKDLGYISGAGRPRVGYKTEELILHLTDFLGCDNPTPAVLVGAGRLGTALLHYPRFEEYGVSILKAFDLPERADGELVLPLSELKDFCREHGVTIGILTVPAASAQAIAEILIEGGVNAIWNFAPVRLCVPEGVEVANEKLALSLCMLRKHQSDD